MNKAQVAAQLRAKAASTTFPAEAAALRSKADDLDPPRPQASQVPPSGSPDIHFFSFIFTGSPVNAQNSAEVIHNMFFDGPKTKGTIHIKKVRKWPKATEPSTQEAWDIGAGGL